MQEHYSARRGVGTHPAADDGFAPKLLLPTAPAEHGVCHGAAPAVPNRRPAILGYASVAMPAGACIATVADMGEGAHAFPPPISAVRGGRA